MKIRKATAADAAAVEALWQEFEAEWPEPPGFEGEDYPKDTVVHVAEDDDGLVGAVEAIVAPTKRWHIETLYVRPHGRRQGVATALVRESVRDARAQGAEWVSLEVLHENDPAQSLWRKLGFEPVEYLLSQPLESLEQRVGDAPIGASRASTHIQTDDRTSVERALGEFVPRLESPDVHDAANGWIRIADPLLDVDRAAQSRFANDLSDRLGAIVVALAIEQGAVVRFRLYERGRMVDEYLSVPEFFGHLSKGDELALAANPTLVARLTGADHDEVRRVARNAASPAELPAPDELYEQLARLMGLEP